MSVIFLLILFSLLLAIGFLIAFIWSVRDGQFDDDYTPSVRILFDSENSDSTKTSSTPTSKEDL
ncbi:MAG: cbb3-type cytochrome oxidase assembly protein CcoS [Bacteroidetes bacterium]|nr:MAG: cbb3-type cytochrome oxidase assembly protein CcoS [Bacteroidota bacterium]